MVVMLFCFKANAYFYFILDSVDLVLNRNSPYIWIFPVISTQDGRERNLVLAENPNWTKCSLLLTVLFPQLCMSLSHNQRLKI